MAFHEEIEKVIKEMAKLKAVLKEKITEVGVRGAEVNTTGGLQRRDARHAAMYQRDLMMDKYGELQQEALALIEQEARRLAEGGHS